MKDDQLRDQVNAIIRDEIQEGINEYLDTQEESEKTGLGFVGFSFNSFFSSTFSVMILYSHPILYQETLPLQHQE